MRTLAQKLKRAAKALYAGAEHVAEVLNSLPGDLGRPAGRRAKR